MANINKTFNIDEDIAEKIDTISKSTGQNKSQVVQSLIKRGFGQVHEETTKIQKVEKQVIEMKDTLEKILSIVSQK